MEGVGDTKKECCFAPTCRCGLSSHHCEHYTYCTQQYLYLSGEYILFQKVKKNRTNRANPTSSQHHRPQRITHRTLRTVLPEQLNNRVLIPTLQPLRMTPPVMLTLNFITNRRLIHNPGTINRLLRLNKSNRWRRNHLNRIHTRIMQRTGMKLPIPDTNNLILIPLLQIVTGILQPAPLTLRRRATENKLIPNPCKPGSNKGYRGIQINHL